MSGMNVYTGAPVRLGESRLPDGRLLGWAEWGPRDGTPVLLCPGAATSRWPGFGPEAVDELGVRLVSVDRPGLGASTPLPGRTFADFAADIRRLCELRELGRPAMVGNSQGAPFALACAAAGVVSALAMSRWPFSLADITVPVDLWYGARDTAHSSDNGALLATRIPRARRRLVPEAGGSLLWTRPKPILASLLEKARTSDKSV
jgi:pimeloyl-ACP methyl ester carboxylesterase